MSRTTQKSLTLRPVEPKVQVANNSEKKARDMKASIARDEAEIEKLRDQARALAQQKREKQALSLMSQVNELNKGIQQKQVLLRRLQQGLKGLNQASDVIEVQKCLKEITAHKSQLLTENDIMELMEDPEKSRAMDIGIEELLQAGATEQDTEQYDKEAANLLAELMAEPESSSVTTTTTTTTTTATTTSPLPARSNGGRPRASEKYKDTAKLLEF